MGLAIRLKRAGRKNQKYWRVVVVSREKARDGVFLEDIGSYNSLSNPPVVKIHRERYSEWIRKGAKPSETVEALMSEKTPSQNAN